MRHLDDDAIVALRDDASADAWTLAHMDECATCVAEVAEARSRSGLIAEALATLDGPVDLLAAKAATRARLDRGRPGRVVPAWRRWPLGRAAILLLASAGAASALTWSPLRSLWSPTPSSTETESPPAAAPAPALDPQMSAIAVPVSDGRIDVIVRGAAPGSSLEVAWSVEVTARIVAPPGSGFTYADGRVEVDATAGPLRIELPRAASAATVVVGNRLFVERTASGVVVHEPVVERTEDIVRFVIPAI